MPEPSIFARPRSSEVHEAEAGERGSVGLALDFPEYTEVRESALPFLSRNHRHWLGTPHWEM